MLLLNGHIVTTGRFPNGEQYIPLEGLNIRAYNKVEWVYEDDEEFVLLAILNGHLCSSGRTAWLKVNYMPHSRMDRANDDYVFSLKYVAQIINNMQWDCVEIKEPHSDVTPAIMNGAVIDNWCMSKVEEAMELSKSDTIFYPDAGAAKRYNADYASAVGIKHRNFKTGNIDSFDFNGEIGPSVLIVDDLCSRGGTFVHSSRLLKGNGVCSISLLVAHCEQTVFKGELFDHVEMLYTSSSNMLKDHKQITIL